jgi:hypothetical protein
MGNETRGRDAVAEVVRIVGEFYIGAEAGGMGDRQTIVITTFK